MAKNKPKDKKQVKKKAEEKDVEKVKKKSPDEIFHEKCMKISPYANLQNRINGYKKMINPAMSGMGSTEKAVNIERANFVKHLEAVQNTLIEYLKGGTKKQA